MNIREETSYIMNSIIIDQHLEDGKLLSETTFSLTVDTDSFIYINLVEDLHFNIQTMNIKHIDGYGDTPGNPYLRSFNIGTTTVEFTVLGHIQAIPKINRKKVGDIPGLLLKEV